MTNHSRRRITQYLRRRFAVWAVPTMTPAPSKPTLVGNAFAAPLTLSTSTTSSWLIQSHAIAPKVFALHR